MKTASELESLVEFTVKFCRLLWGAIFLPEAFVERRKDGYTSITSDSWRRYVSDAGNCDVLEHEMMRLLEEQHVVIRETGMRFAFWSRALSAVQLIAYLQGDDWQNVRPFLRYCLWRNVRRTYNLGQNKATIGSFHKLSNLLNERTKGSLAVVSLSELRQITEAATPIKRTADAFIEVCLHLQIIKPSHGGHFKSSAKQFNQRIVIEPNIDAEFLLSNVFGVPTSIPGYDQLFGGGGMILGESERFSKEAKSVGRVIFIKGGFGAGKTTLALSLAAEVARKGGLSWFIPLEQSAADCEMCLTTLNLCSDLDTEIEVIRKRSDLEEYVVNSGECPRGHVIALASIEKDQISSVLSDLTRIVEDTHGAADLRLFVIDSFNCILDLGIQDPRELRSAMVDQIRAIVATGANLIISGETEMLGNTNTNFVQNIADVVISLDSDTSVEGYCQRYIQVEKSRLQREQRGAHAYSIKAGVGFDIYPSSAATAARMRNRRLSSGEGETKFGWRNLDDILGEGAVQPGDVIAIEGDSGCLKTHLGLLFAMALEARRPPGRESDSPNTLILALGDRKNTINRMASNRADWLQGAPKKHASLIIKEGLAVGFIQPGKVFQLIDEAFDSCVGKEWINRVWVDNLWRWDWLCPFIQKDRTFGQTLVDYFRKKNVTSLFTCRNIDSDVGGLQRAILDLANVRIKVQRVEHRGNMMLVVRVIKTRGMRHKTDNFILEFDGESMRLSDAGNMLRMDARGMHAIGTRLFLHSETEAQNLYNQFVEKTMEPLMGSEIVVKSENRTLSVSTDRLSELATVDELQLWQLDEFQVATQRLDDGADYCNALNESELYPQVVDRVRDDKGMWAVPYFRNIGLLAVDEGVPDSAIASWQSMAKYAAEVDSSERSFFDFAKPSNETFVCMWIEMLSDMLCKTRGDAALTSAVEVMRGQNADDLELVKSVCLTFRALCRPGYLRSMKSPVFQQDAMVSRQWFTTLGSFLQRARTEGMSHQIKSLPSACSVAGDWYLSVPTYSSAPACARRLVQFMTSVDQQSYRLSNGVGLPVRPELLGGGGIAVTGDTIIDVDIINATFARVFRRSTIPNYRTICQQWALCIKHLLEVADDNHKAISGLATSIAQLNSAAVKM